MELNKIIFHYLDLKNNNGMNSISYHHSLSILFISKLGVK
jgi:hypothetical protein